MTIDAASARTKYVTRRRNLSHLDAGTATHALPGLSYDVFPEVTALEVILLRGCLNFTEGGLGDESIIQQGPRYALRSLCRFGLALRRDEATKLLGRKELYNYHIAIISLTSELLIFTDAKITRAYPSLASPRRDGKANWLVLAPVPQFGLGPKPKWEGPTPTRRRGEGACAQPKPRRGAISRQTSGLET